MKREILVAPELLPDALDELKIWLAITTSQDDTTLLALLGSALDMCEAFTRTMPLTSQCEERLVPEWNWQWLSTVPIHAITGVEELLPDTSRRPLHSGDYAVELEADGRGRIRLISPAVGGMLAVQYTAGLASTWTNLPESLRHGVIRLAAYLYRQRDMADARPAPPASVAALWNPWRRMRLA